MAVSAHDVAQATLRVLRSIERDPDAQQRIRELVEADAEWGPKRPDSREAIERYRREVLAGG